MKKCIYFGVEKDFWWHTRFKKFLDSLSFMELLVKNDFSMLDDALNLPLLYYSHKDNVLLKYKRESTYINSDYLMKRVDVTLFGKDEVDIENLEWLIKDEAKKHQKIDDLKTL